MGESDGLLEEWMLSAYQPQAVWEEDRWCHQLLTRLSKCLLDVLLVAIESRLSPQSNEHA